MGSPIKGIMLPVERLHSQMSVAGMRKINTWCNALDENEEDSSMTSSELSSVDPSRSPSQGFEDY